MFCEIEVGDKVAFANVKHLKLPTKTKYNIPLCLWGLNVEGKPVDRYTTFKVKYISCNGIIIELDEYPDGLYFDRVWLEYAGTSIDALLLQKQKMVEHSLEEYEPF